MPLDFRDSPKSKHYKFNSLALPDGKQFRPNQWVKKLEILTHLIPALSILVEPQANRAEFLTHVTQMPDLALVKFKTSKTRAEASEKDVETP